VVEVPAAAVWAGALLGEGGFIWLFFGALYHQGQFALTRLRSLAAAVALLGVIATPTIAYLMTVAPPGVARASGAKSAPARELATSSRFSLGAASAERGRALFEEQNCLACHRLRSRGGSVAPDLWGVANRRDPEWIFHHFKSPQEVSPGTLMPRFSLADDQFRDLTAYLLTLRDNP
jgi:mono/diheme cytochrome c family protein